MFLAVALLSLLALQIYYVFLRPHRHWKRKHVKHDATLPIFGNIYEHVMQKASMSEIVQRLYNKYKDERYFGFYEFFSPILVLRDPELIQDVCVKDFDSFVDHQLFSNEDLDPLWSKNLFASKGERWKSMRSTLSSAFTLSKLKTMYPLIADCSDKFVDYFNRSDEEVVSLEMWDTFSRYTNDVIATCALGVTCDSHKDRSNEFYLKGCQATDFSGLKNLKFIGCSLSPTLMKILNVKIITDDVGDFFRKLIRDTIRLREERGIVRPDLIHILLEARRKALQSSDPKTLVFTDEDITAQALVFYTAGFGTSSTLMIFLAYELAANPEVQERLRKEVDETLTRCDGKVTYEALAGMKYFDMLVSETLRKWPIAPVNDRVCTKDYVVKASKPGEQDLLIEKGTTVWLPLYGIQRDPKYFQDPENFDPERFNDECKDWIAPSTNFGFGLGPRACIGSRFALLETKSVFFSILSKFEIVPVDKTVIPVVLSKKHFTIAAEEGMFLGFKKRKSALKLSQ